MKNILAIILLSLLVSCAAQNNAIKGYATNTNPIKDSLMFEKFDFELAKSDYKDYVHVPNSSKTYGINGFYYLKNGAVFNPNYGNTNIYNYVVPSPPAFYCYWYNYYQNGNKESFGKKAGVFSSVLIGEWRYYDETGNLTKTVNEEEKFGLWGFNKVLDVLDKDKVIDLKTGRNREAENLRFNFDKEKKLWTVKVFKKQKSTLVDIYWEYLFDGNTGKYTRDWFEKYNLNAADMPSLPPLKNSKTNKYKKS